MAHEPAAVRTFFGFGDESTGAVPFDLGGRVLEVLGTPGHHQASITIYDPWTGLLLTGDTILPGRLYIEDQQAFRTTMDTLVAFAETHPVTHVLGCHVEMTRRPGRDYALGAQFQPRERALQMPPTVLTDIQRATAKAAGKPGIHPHPDFILYLEPGQREQRHLLRRARIRQLQEKFLNP